MRAKKKAVMWIGMGWEEGRETTKAMLAHSHDQAHNHVAQKPSAPGEVTPAPRLPKELPAGPPSLLPGTQPRSRGYLV